MNPEIRDRRIIAIAGKNSSGKSETAKRLSLLLRHPEGDRHTGIDTRVIHVGELFRLCASLPGGFPLDSPQAIHQSAHEALAHVHMEVDSDTGEIVLKPNGIDKFVQTAHNGHASSRLGGNPHLAEFVQGFVGGLLETHLPEGAIAIIDGRESWGSDILVRTHPESLAVQAAFFYQERPEAHDWPIGKVEETIKERMELDGPVLQEVMERTDHVIELHRSTHDIEATKRAAQKISGVIFSYRDGQGPKDFDVQPVRIDDR